MREEITNIRKGCFRLESRSLFIIMYGHFPSDSMVTSKESPSLLQTSSSASPMDVSRAPSLCIAVIGATGELARGKIFPALFALYYSGFLPEVQQFLLIPPPPLRVHAFQKSHFIYLDLIILMSSNYIVLK